ncbi:MAG: alpha/beta fold hydrolase [Burkholderiales bacterium]|nr:alpha/beta fold hydrolase [Burkholderiales bacterium]
MTEHKHTLPGMHLQGRRFRLPLDYANPHARQIEVFAREVVAPGRASAALPYLIFFQGGPGFGSPRPSGLGGWIKRALRDYRVLLLDQRGTGLSTPVTAQTLRRLGSAEAQAEYVQHFRADNIVRDAEAIRQQLIGDTPWTVLGQSFGGFCAMHYLSTAPHALYEVLITGGIPPLARPADDVYRATYARVIAKNRNYYERYPEDVPRVRDIVRYLSRHEVVMPSGGRLTPERFLQLGIAFGASDGFESVHYLVEEAFVGSGDTLEINYNFLVGVEHAQPFDTNPIYTLLHEACYAQNEASRWSAQRLLAEFREFSVEGDAAADVAPILFTGEMIYPWMLEQYAQLRPLKPVAELLAAKADWPMLYDVARLQKNRVPVAAVAYYNDMYVHREFSEEAAALVPNVKLWVTSEYEHNGLRADGEAILDRLLNMVRGC